MQSQRILRVRELLKRALAEILRREIPISEAGLVAVNEVDVAADLQAATVYVGIVGTKDQKQRGLAILERETKRIQSLLGHAVVLKYTPRLKFVLDDSVERGNRILSIIEEIERTAPKE